MKQNIKNLLKNAQHIVVMQPENPDGDSLGSALALEEILEDAGKKVSLYCAVNIPKYLRHYNGWDRVENKFAYKADAAIIVDTLSETLLSQSLKDPTGKHFLQEKPVLAIDHHAEVGDELPFEHEAIIDGEAIATGQIIADIFSHEDWKINSRAATALYSAIMADTLGLTTPNVNAKSFRTVADLIDKGANPAEIEEARRLLMKKSPEILAYKGRLIERIEYFLDGQLALVIIPWEEIEKYSDQYNPSMLVLDEMRLVEDVKLAVALKTYPDGRVTGKLRANSEAKIADIVAGYFGGGGHGYAAGFRAYEKPEVITKEVLTATQKALAEIK